MTPAERIKEIWQYSGLLTKSAFARKLGLRRSENIHQIVKGNNGISLKLAQKIRSIYPEISLDWLLFGEGEMLIWRIDCADAGLRKEGGIVDLRMPKKYGFSWDKMMRLESDRYSPVIERGALLFMQSDVRFIEPGKIYLSQKSRGIKIIIPFAITSQVIRYREFNQTVKHSCRNGSLGKLYGFVGYLNGD